MTGTAVGLAVLIAIPLGVLCGKGAPSELLVTWVGSIGQTVPSLAS